MTTPVQCDKDRKGARKLKQTAEKGKDWAEGAKTGDRNYWGAETQARAGGWGGVSSHGMS